MKNLIPLIMLIALGTALPVNAFAKIDAATLDKQRKENKARLEKAQELRLGKPKKRLFCKSEVEATKLRSLKLDAIPPSPRRSARPIPKNTESALPANPGRSTSITSSERNPEAVTAPRE